MNKNIYKTRVNKENFYFKILNRIADLTKISYSNKRNETTIYFKEVIKRDWVKDFILFKGKIEFKGKNPRGQEILNFIKMKGGLKK